MQRLTEPSVSIFESSQIQCQDTVLLRRREMRARKRVGTKMEGSEVKLMMERKTGHLCLMTVCRESGKWDETKMKRRESGGLHMESARLSR